MVYTLTQRRRWLQLDHSTKSRTKRNHQSTMMFVFLVVVTITIFLSPVRTSATGTSSAETITLESDTTPLWNSHEFIHRSRNADAQLNTLPSSSLSSSSSSSSVPSTPTTQTTTTTATTKERSARQRRQLLDEMYYVRRRTQQQQQRQLPGNEMMGDIDLMSAEAGFMVGFSFLIILLFLCLCCCCCRRRPYGGGGGGGGSNCLWDLVAIVCLWEMCCDNDGIMGDGFMRF